MTMALVGANLLAPKMDKPIPPEIFRLYNVLSHRFRERMMWDQMTEDELWTELCLCILSSNVPYELAKSCNKHLADSGLLDGQWIASRENAQIAIGKELQKPIYLPQKKNGELRRYRFPMVRARNIALAAKFFYRYGDGITDLLRKSNSHTALRNYLAENVSGLGLKESSHFLRNVGYSSSLAVVDSHLIEFMKNLGLLPADARIILTPKQYYIIENIMIWISRKYQVDLAVFDNAIWNYMRGN